MIKRTVEKDKKQPQDIRHTHTQKLTEIRLIILNINEINHLGKKPRLSQTGLKTKSKWTRITKTVLKKKNEAGGITLSNFKTITKLVIKVVWYWQRGNRSKEETGKYKTDPHKYSQFIFDAGTKAVQWRKDNLFYKWFWKTWISTCKIMKFKLNLISYIKKDLYL